MWYRDLMSSGISTEFKTKHEEEQHSLMQALRQSWVRSVSNFIFFALAYEGAWLLGRSRVPFFIWVPGPDTR